MKKILSTSILALAGLAFAASSASAALSYNDGDLIVAFRGTSTTYLINIGQVSQFQAGGSFADGNLHTLSIGNIATDLGSGFNPTAWSIQSSDPFGQVSPFSNNTVWATTAETTAGVASSAPIIDGANLANASSGIQGMAGIYGQGNATANNVAGNLQANSTAGSYKQWNFGGESPTSAYNFFLNGVEGSFAGGAASSVLDLYEYNQSNDGQLALLLGGFQVSSTGSLSFSSDVTDFSASPVPEPATLAFGFAVLGACAMGRFRTRQQAELAA